MLWGKDLLSLYSYGHNTQQICNYNSLQPIHLRQAHTTVYYLQTWSTQTPPFQRKDHSTCATNRHHTHFRSPAPHRVSDTSVPLRVLEIKFKTSHPTFDALRELRRWLSWLSRRSWISVRHHKVAHHDANGGTAVRRYNACMPSIQ